MVLGSGGFGVRKSFGSFAGATVKGRYRGREGHRPPLPPNRACGFPAHGSPVSGFLIGIGSLGGLRPW